MNGTQKNIENVYQERRKSLVKNIREKYGVSQGAVLLFANFERDGVPYKQDSSFYYFTGLEEPGITLLIDFEGASTLYIPDFGDERSKWVHDAACKTNDYARSHGFDAIEHLGSKRKGYMAHPFFTKDEYSTLISSIEKLIKRGVPLFGLNPKSQYEYFEQRFVLDRLNHMMPQLVESVQDIAPIVARLRRKKSKQEIEYLYKAIEVSIQAQEFMLDLIKPGTFERSIEAAMEYQFINSGAQAAFKSVVATGKNATILHYNSNQDTLKKNELIVIDMGAQLNHYCADLTRTYPVSGKFTKRQEEIYYLVLETQEYITGLAKPGMWLSNTDKPKESLNHLARNFLKEKGYDKYFPHGIGHFLGLDVHDVGDYKQPLAVGDVITIEPGIYIPEESLGVRIEDDYWVVADGVICLSENLPKNVRDIESLLTSEK